jgi:hypothetical protein
MGLRASDAQKSGDPRKSRLPMFARLPKSYEHLSNMYWQSPTGTSNPARV